MVTLLFTNRVNGKYHLVLDCQLKFNWVICYSKKYTKMGYFDKRNSKTKTITQKPEVLAKLIQAGDL